jgi:RNA polymerase sigma-70 factor (ECF subfamily)
MQRPVTQADPGLELAPGLLRLAGRLAGATGAEDLVQATYLRALEHGGSVREPRSWLRRVLLNERWMDLRRRRRRDAREQSIAGNAELDVEHVVHCLEVARLVARLVEELDEDVRLVVRERYFEGCSAADIARRHRIPAGTVRWRLKVGLDRLRTQLDAHHGGRRVLWAGSFAPLATSPTPWPAVASVTKTASGTATAAAKGPSIMSIPIKILLSMGVVAASGAYVATKRTEPTPVAASSLAVESPSLVQASARPSPHAKAVETPTPGKTAWAQRLSMIHQAHDIDVADPGAEGAAAAGPELRVSTCTEQGCVERLTSEVAGMVDGCRELAVGVAPDISIVARVVGAPDVGTLVESVELSGGAAVPEALRDCLAETMYTLDLGPTEQSFAQIVTVLLGGRAMSTLEYIRGTELDEPTRVAVEAAMADASQPGNEGKTMVFVHEAEPATVDD